MNNQKDYTISEFFTLPSDGKVYSELIDPQIELRSMTTAEEMRRMSPNDHIYENLCSIIDDCLVKGPNISSYDMCLGDYQFLLYKLRLVTYGSEYNVPVKIARLSQTFGAGVEKNDNRVFAQFSKSVINKENIILHTKGETARNYCYTTDAVRAIFTILTKGKNNVAYNVANKKTYISIADMAKNLENENTKVIFEIDNKNRGFNPTMQICLNTEKLENLGWRAKVDLPEMFERTIKSMTEENE